MAAKSVIAGGLLFGAEFFTQLYKTLEARGFNREQILEVIEREFKTGSGLVEQVADLLISTSRRALRFLKLITESIAVSVESFTKDSFFSNGPVKIHFWDSFRNWIPPIIPATIPALTTSLSSFDLTRNMYDKDILAELGNPQPFTVSELAGIMKDLLSKQPTGEAGNLLTNGSVNIFYVLLEDGRVVAVYVRWFGDYREWGCNANGLGSGCWRGGDRVFSRS